MDPVLKPLSSYLSGNKNQYVYDPTLYDYSRKKYEAPTTTEETNVTDNTQQEEPSFLKRLFTPSETANINPKTINEDEIRKLVDEEYKYRKDVTDEKREARVKERLEHNLAAANKKQENLENAQNAPNEIFGKESYEYFKKNNPDSGIMTPVGYVLSAPNRIPLLNRIIKKASEAMGGEGAIAENAPVNQYKDTTGNKVVDKLADMGGSMVGLAETPTGDIGNKNLLNFADGIAEKAGEKAAGKIGNKVLSNVVKGATRGAVDNAMGYMADDVRFNGGQDLAGSAVEGALGGAIFGGALSGVGTVKNGITNKITNKLNDDFNFYNEATSLPKFNNAGIKSITDDGLTIKRNPFASPQIEETNVEAPKVETPIVEAPKIEDVAKAENIPDIQNISNAKKSNALPNLDVPSSSELSYNSSKPLAERQLDIYSAEKKDISAITRDRKVNAIAYDYPELKPYIQQEAKSALHALENDNIAGERYYHYDDITGKSTITGIPNVADPSIKDMQNLGLTYAQIRRGLNDIIEDNGKENNATAKRVEFVLDHDLSNGKLNVRGDELPANNDYISAKKDIMDLESGKLENFGLGTQKASNSELDKLEKEYAETKKMRERQIESANQNNDPYRVQEINKQIKADAIEYPTRTKNVENNIDGDDFLDADSINLDFDDDMAMEINVANSKMKDNTYRNAEFMQGEDVQKVVDDVSGLYEVKANKESYNNAVEMLNKDFEGTVERLKNNGIRSAEDSVASGLITNKLMQDARKSGDYSELQTWLETTRSEATNLGQTIQALSTWKKLSPEGTLIQMQKIIDGAKENLKEADPNKYAQMERELKEVTEQSARATKDTTGKGATSKGVQGADKELIGEIMKKYDIPYWSDSEIGNLVERSSKIEEMAEGRAKDVEIAKLKKELVEKIPSSGVDKLRALQRINLLLNPKTMIRNPLGNVIMGGLENIKDIPATMIDSALSKITGERTTTLPNIGEQLKGMKEGFSNVIDDYKQGINTGMSQGRYELPETKAFKGNKGIVDKTLSKAEDLTSTGLRLGDEPFFKGAYNDELKRQMKLKGVSEATEQMKEQAMNVAKDKTFQNDSAIAKRMKQMQNGLNVISTKTPDGEFGLGNIIMPFIKTPANIMDKAVDYSPIGGVKGITNLVKGLKKGNLNQREVVDQLSRGLTGTALIGVGAIAAKEGLLQGSGAEDADAAALEKQTGKMPYSIKVGNTYNSIDWAQPAAIPLMIGADVYNALKNDEKGMSALVKGAETGGATLFNQSLLQGLSQLFGGYGTDNGMRVMEGVKNSVFNAAEQFVPFNSGMKAINDVLDPYTRDTSSSDIAEKELSKIKAKIPGLSEMLPKKVDTMGNESQKFYGEGALKAFNTLINPGKTSEYNPTKAEKLALDLYNETGEKTQMPRKAPKTITYKPSKGAKSEKITLTLEEKNEMQRIMGQKTEEEFNKIDSNLSDEQKIKKMTDKLTEIQQEAGYEILKKRGIKYYKK